MTDNNTRRFARSLDQAFPFGASYGCAIERPRSNPVADYATVIVIGLGLCAALASWWLS